MRLFSDDSTSITDPYLRHAFDLAVRGAGTTSPNPMVGCVVVNNDVVVGEGWHEQAGGPHAEIVALQRAGQAARGATVYVTLEPCAHHGRTPPCTDALISHGVADVVCGMPDPSDVARGGAERLRSAGIGVSFAEDPVPFEELNKGWLSLVSRRRPWVTVKVACTLDGHVSARAGERTRISGDDSARLTMRLRALADAVVVGARTAHVDAPALTCRTPDGADSRRQPLRVVLTRDTDPSGIGLLGDGRGPAAVLAPDDSDFGGVPAGVERLAYRREEGLEGALSTLGRHGVTRVLVEPGRELFSALWDGRLIDELVIIHAGTVFGQSAVGMYATGTAGTAVDRGWSMKATESAILGDDAVTVWRKS